jgi:peptidoglycan/xylan/chitin deacetylase (PgdA/CDA1 family)
MQDGSLLRVWNALGRVDARLTGGTLPATGGDGVLMFHSIGDSGFDDLSPSAFRSLIARLDETVTFVDLPELFKTDSTERRVALTFDDGYEGYHDHVVPILKEFDAPSTVFVVASTLGNGPVTVDENVRGRFMSPEQVASVADEDLVTVGNHTMTHPSLPSVTSRERLREEVTDAKTTIENELGVSVERFCYPYNNVSRAAVSVVRQSHDWAVWGGGWRETLSMQTHPSLVPRVNGAQPWWQLRWHLLDRGKHLARSAEEGLSFLRCVAERGA